MTANRRIFRNLALSGVVSAWLGVVVARAAGVIYWPWLWVLGPYWMLIIGLVCFVVGFKIGSLLARGWFWLVMRTERRRREREIREFRRSLDHSLCDLIENRSTRARAETERRRSRR